MIKNHNTGKIIITEHAMDRLIQRVQNYDKYRSWKELVKRARYEGDTIFTMPECAYKYCVEHNILRRLDNSSQVRYYDGFFFIFRGQKGHARTLVTVINPRDAEKGIEDNDF
jgi:hypothetical protein